MTKQIIFTLALLFSSNYAFAQALEYRDFSLCKNLAEQGLEQSALEYCTKYLATHDNTSRLIDSMYILVRIDAPRTDAQIDIQNLTLQKLAPANKTNDEYYKLALIHFHLQSFTQAASYASLMSPKSTEHRDYYQFTAQYNFENSQCPQTLKAIDELSKSTQEDALNLDLDAYKNACQFVLKPSTAGETKVTESLENKDISLMARILTAKVMSNHFYVAGNTAKTVSYLTLWNDLSIEAGMNVDLDLEVAKFVYKKYLPESPVKDEAEIATAIKKMDQIKIDAKNKEVLLMRGWLYFIAGDDKSASANLTKYRQELGLSKISYDLNIAQIYQVNGHSKLSGEYLEKAIANSSSQDLATALALKWQEDYKYNRCSAIISDSKKADLKPDSAKPALIFLANCLTKNKEHKAAVELFSNLALNFNAEANSISNYLVSSSLINSGGLPILLQAVNNAPDNYIVLASAAQSLLDQAKNQEAETIIESAFRENWNSQNNKNFDLLHAKTLFRLKKNSDAELLFNKLLTAEIESSTDESLLIKLIQEANNSLSNKDQATMLARIIDQGERFSNLFIVELKLELGKLYYQKLNNTKEARRVLSPIVADTRIDNALAISIVTESYIKDKNIKQAELFLKNSLGHVPKKNQASPSLHYRLAELNQAIGNEAKAIVLYQNVIKDYPNSVQAKEAKKILATSNIKN